MVQNKDEDENNWKREYNDRWERDFDICLPMDFVCLAIVYSSVKENNFQGSLLIDSNMTLHSMEFVNFGVYSFGMLYTPYKVFVGNVYVRETHRNLKTK